MPLLHIHARLVMCINYKYKYTSFCFFFCVFFTCVGEDVLNDILDLPGLPALVPMYSWELVRWLGSSLALMFLKRFRLMRWRKMKCPGIHAVLGGKSDRMLSFCLQE